DGAGEHSLDALLRAAHAPTHPAHAPTHPAHAPTRPTRGEPLTGTLAGSRDRGPGEAPPTRPPDLRAPTAWVFGNEAHGLSAEARRAADAIVRIPIYGRAESYNLAMAATLCLHASATARAPTRPRVTAGE
ncbi:MAG: hypothetical protein LBK72_03745, partial [Bifidobacteriaceae bacterium]|nr:hypothetical protein [Bifidobacteriaceae bacterium]